MKKVSKLIFSLILFFACSILFDGCSCSLACFVKVTFVEMPEDIKLEGYKKEVEFEGSHKIEFEIPEGYLESGIKIYLEDVEQEFEVEYLKAEKVDEEHLYSVKKKITFTVEKIKRGVDVKVDMSDLHKKTFDIKLPGSTDGFEVVVISPDEIKKGLMSLSDKNVVRKVQFIDGKAQIEFGEDVALIYDSVRAGNLSKIYTNKGYFSDPKKVKTLNGTEYLEYSIAQRGNNYYSYGGNSYSRIIYFGEVKENIDFLYGIPNYKSSNNIHIGDGFNTFYLLTNLQKYNSDLITIESYVVDENATYSINNSLVDKIGEKVISKIVPTEEYYDKYDLHKIYIGDTLSADPLLDESEKKELHNEIYFKIKSEVVTNKEDLWKIDARLLINEQVYFDSFVEVENYIESEKGAFYIKISKENLNSFYNKYMYEHSSGNQYEYCNGSAILMVSLDKGYCSSERTHGTFKYSSFTLDYSIDNSIVGNAAKNTHMIVYIDNTPEDSTDNNNDYGYIDYHSTPMYEVAYLRTDKIFDSEGKYKNNLCVDVYGEDYKGYTSTRLSTINLVWNVGEYLTKTPISVEDATAYNGHKRFHITDNSGRIITKHKLNEYTITAKVTFIDVEKNNFTVDFSNLELPSDLTQGVYVTNNYNVSSLSDFRIINYITKETEKNFNFGYNRELYYLIPSKNLQYLEVDIYLDVEKKKLVSHDNILYDITGKEVIITVNGEPFVVRYKYMSVSYEVPDANEFHMLSK